jgi:hypothetical protein
MSGSQRSRRFSSDRWAWRIPGGAWAADIIAGASAGFSVGDIREEDLFRGQRLECPSCEKERWHLQTPAFG